jgi:hypothetical protein
VLTWLLLFGVLMLWGAFARAMPESSFRGSWNGKSGPSTGTTSLAISGAVLSFFVSGAILAWVVGSN